MTAHQDFFSHGDVWGQYDATGALLAFYQGEHDEAQATAALTAALAELAWHRSNVTKTHQPELPL